MVYIISIKQKTKKKLSFLIVQIQQKKKHKLSEIPKKKNYPTKKGASIQADAKKLNKKYITAVLASK